MKRPFWIKGSTTWDTIKINFNLVFSIISDTATTILCILCFIGILYLVFYKIPKAVMNASKESSAVRYKQKAERTECLKMEYAGKKFYKFKLEGHEYWYVSNFEHLGFCHSESCPCKTNKVEVVQ